MGVNWDYYDKFDKVMDKYLPFEGEGETKATQIVTAVTKLVYKYYNDGDVFDNTSHLEGWANDLSDYANWLYHRTTDAVQKILNKVYHCHTEDEYEDLLQELADELLNEEYLAKQGMIAKECSIYNYEGKFEFKEVDEDEDDYFCYDEEEDDYY